MLWWKLMLELPILTSLTEDLIFSRRFLRLQFLQTLQCPQRKELMKEFLRRHIGQNVLEVLDNMKDGVFPDLFAEAKEDKSRNDALGMEMADENMALEDIGAVEVVHADYAEMAVKVSGAADVVHADDAETTLKDSGASETMQTDVTSRFTPAQVSEACLETVCGGPEEVVVEAGLEKSSGQEEVVVEAGVEESTTVDGKDSRPGYEGTQDVAFGMSDCREISEARSEHMLVLKEGDATQVGLEETDTNGGDLRLGCKEIQILSSTGGAVSRLMTEVNHLQAALVYSDAGSSRSLPDALHSHEEALQPGHRTG